MGTEREGFFRRRARTVTIGVQAVIADADQRVLLVRHGYREGWHFPGGGVELGETVLAAISREVREETGVVLESEPRLFGLYSHFDEFPGDHIALFVAERWSQPHVPPANREIVERRFFSLSAVPDATTRGTRRRLEEVFSGAKRATAW